MMLQPLQRSKLQQRKLESRSYLCCGLILKQLMNRDISIPYDYAVPLPDYALIYQCHWKMYSLLALCAT